VVLITGAAGGVAGHLRRELAGRYELRLSDVRPLPDRAPGERFAKADLARLPDVVRVTRGVDAVIHLGGYAVEGPWPDILEANVVGCYNLFEAARRNGVRRVLFASSNHAVGFYRRDERIDDRAPPRPDGRYGVSKVFGEALGRLYADKYGLEVLCVRIGNVNPAPVDARRLSIWVSPRDLAQLCVIGLEHPDLRFEIVYGISGNARRWYDNANAERLGYRPQDDSERFAAEILARDEREDPVAARLQGGAFTVVEDVPNPAAPRKRRRGPARPTPPRKRKR
jgi:uronate dehydrogenase